MIFALIWAFFVFSMSLAKDLDQCHYFFFSSLMLGFTYLYDQIYSIRISLQTNLCLLFIPSIILWYIVFVYNSFLCLTPIKHEILVGFLFLYTYVILYVFWECS